MHHLPTLAETVRKHLLSHQVQRKAQRANNEWPVCVYAVYISGRMSRKQRRNVINTINMKLKYAEITNNATLPINPLRSRSLSTSENKTCLCKYINKLQCYLWQVHSFLNVMLWRITNTAGGCCPHVTKPGQRITDSKIMRGKHRGASNAIVSIRVC